MSGTTADPAAGESSSEAHEEGWVTQVLPGAARTIPAADHANARDDDAHSKKKTADNTADPAARKRSSVDGKEDLFQPDPQYEKNYNAEGQVDIYGAKSAVEPPRPLLELGREQYTSGIYDESSTLLGEIESAAPGPRHLRRLADGGRLQQQQRQGYCPDRDPAEHRRRPQDHRHRTNTRLLHAASGDNNKFTRFEFGGGDANGKFNDEFDLRPADAVLRG